MPYVIEFIKACYLLKMVSVSLTIRLQVYAKVFEYFSSIGGNILKYILMSYYLFLCYVKHTKIHVQVGTCTSSAAILFFLTDVVSGIKAVSVLS